jgi:hypothetical protein
MPSKNKHRHHWKKHAGVKICINGRCGAIKLTNNNIIYIREKRWPDGTIPPPR